MNAGGMGRGLAWGILLSLVAGAGAETVLVDFGNNSSYRGTNVANPDVNGRYWNSVHSGAFYANLIDTANQATTIDLGFDAAPGTDNYNGPGGAFDASGLGMLGVTNAVNDYYISSRFQLQGLDMSRTYTLTFYGSHKYSTDDATVYAVCSDNTYATTMAVVSLNVQLAGSPCCTTATRSRFSRMWRLDRGA